MSKTSDAAAVLLALLVTVAPPRARIYVYASDEAQAALLLDALAGFAERSGLLGLVEIGARTVVCKASLAMLSVEASDSASAFGVRPWAICADEVSLWPDTPNHGRLWASIISSLGKVAGSRLLVLCSAGSPTHPAAKRWEAAGASEHWRTSLTPGPSPWWSVEDVEAARHDLTPAEWRRYIACEWAEADDALATAEDVAACTGKHRVLEPRRGTRYLMALDLGLRRDATALAIGHMEPSRTGRRVVIDRVMRWTGTRDRPVSLTEVEATLLAAWKHYGRPRLVFDRTEAHQLTERLRKAGVACDEFTFSPASVNRLARALYGALRDRAVVLPDEPVLTDELRTVRLVERGPGLLKLDHRAGQHDDMAVVAAMLVATLLERPAGGGRLLVPDGQVRPAQLVTRRERPPLEAPPTILSEQQRACVHPVQRRAGELCGVCRRRVFRKGLYSAPGERRR